MTGSYSNETRQELIVVVKGVLCGDIGRIAGCRKLSELFRELEVNLDDKDLVIFAQVDWETSALPVGAAAPLLNPESVHTQEAAIQTVKKLYADSIHGACRKPVERMERELKEDNSLSDCTCDEAAQSA